MNSELIKMKFDFIGYLLYQQIKLHRIEKKDVN